MRKLMCLGVFALMMSSCVVVKVPPGQAKKSTPPPGQTKKMTGSKSAAPYAPGQQKKAAPAKKKS